MGGIDLSNHYFISTSESINTILAPALATLGLNFFRYLKLYNDGARIHLCNNSAWTDHFYQESLYKVAWYDRYLPGQHISSRSVWDDKAISNDNIVGIHARTIFDINHGFSVIRPNADYCEVFDFATTMDNVAVNDVYMRCPESIDEIIYFFNSDARHIILKAEQHKIQLPMEARVDVNCPVNNLHYAAISRYYMSTQNGELYLTRKEYDCLSLWFCGKTAKQIAIILSMSFRTVETHLENIKGKFNLQYKEQLLNYIQSMGLFEALIKRGFDPVLVSRTSMANYLLEKQNAQRYNLHIGI